MNNETTPAAGTCTGEPPCSPLRSFFHELAAVSANVIKATPEEVKQLHEVADKCADEHEANQEPPTRCASDAPAQRPMADAAVKHCGDAGVTKMDCLQGDAT